MKHSKAAKHHPGQLQHHARDVASSTGRLAILAGLAEASIPAQRHVSSQTTRKKWQLVLILLVAIGVQGCHLAGPNFGPQGTFDYQRGQAVLHDPFPNNEVAPPIVGARAPGYTHPLPEPKNIQEFRNRGARVQPYYGF